ncbi:MAG: PAS domain S-box protein [Bacteroidota bacterium]
MKILLLEDSPADAEIIKRFLLKEKMQCEFRLVTDRKSFLEALDEFSPRVILSDNSMPQFNASEALKITRLRSQYIPFIMVTGTVSEEFAASIIKQGADDYILKDRMSRLPAAIETALKQREAEKEITDYKYALDQGYLVSFTDEKGIIQYANDNFCKISGYTAEELTGVDHRIVNSGYHPKSYFCDMWAIIGRGEIWKGEFCNKAKDGSLYWVETAIVPFLNDWGRPYQYLSMRTDITERKRVEAELQKSNERFKYATMASSDIIWELNFETGEYNVYEGKEKLVGFNTISHWQLGIDGEYIVTEDRERVKKSFDEARSNPATTLWNEEYRIYSVNNSILDIINHAIFIRNEKGETIRAIGAITDITEKKKLESELFEQHRNEQLKITATALDAQEKERNAIGQELHDNVNQILMGTKLLLSVVKNDPEENHSLISSCMENLQNAIDENRKIAHVLVAPDFHSISLTDQLSNLVDSMLKTSGIETHIDTEDLQEKLMGEACKLPVYRIAQEQCTNIAKYSGARVVNILLSTTNSVFKMVISDDGKGMESNKKTNGIGLKNIKGRLSILNGTASIITSPGKGFTLEVSIPI